MIQAQLNVTEEHLQLCALFYFEDRFSLCGDSLGWVLYFVFVGILSSTCTCLLGQLNVNVLSLLWSFVFIIFLFSSPSLTTFMWCFTTGNNKAFAQ